MRFLIFSDLHGNQYAWKAFSEKLREIDYDRLVFLGDIFGYYYGQDALLRELSRMKDMIWLRGNHDQFFLDLLTGKREEASLIPRYGSTYHAVRSECAWAEKLLGSKKFSFPLEADGKRILLCHGTPEDPEAGRLYPKDPWLPDRCGEYDVVICGHTRFRMGGGGGGKLWINVGSLGQPRDGSHSGALLFDSEYNRYEFIDVFYDKKPLLEEIDRNDPDLEKLKEILSRERKEEYAL